MLPAAVGGDNIMVCNYNQAVSGFGKISISKEKRLCQEQIEKYAVKTQGASQIIGNLSGGNQQKVLIARWLMTEPDIIILDEPTRGIDVGSKSEIHKMISRLAQQGVAVILISSELPEVIGMSDRIMVMYEGRITGKWCAARRPRRISCGMHPGSQNNVGVGKGERFHER